MIKLLIYFNLNIINIFFLFKNITQQKVIFKVQHFLLLF